MKVITIIEVNPTLNWQGSVMRDTVDSPNSRDFGAQALVLYSGYVLYSGVMV